MTKRTHRSRTCAALIPLLMAVSSFAAHAQAYRVRPLATNPAQQQFNGSLQVAVSTTSVSFSLVPRSTAPGTPSVTVTTTYYGTGSTATLQLYGYFNSSTAALSNGGAYDIPSSAVLGQVTTGLPTSYEPFSQTTPFGAAGAGLELVNTTITPIFDNIFYGQRSDVLNLEIDLAGVPDLPAGTYTGTLTLQASIN